MSGDVSIYRILDFPNNWLIIWVYIFYDVCLYNSNYFHRNSKEFRFQNWLTNAELEVILATIGNFDAEEELTLKSDISENKISWLIISVAYKIHHAASYEKGTST